MKQRVVFRADGNLEIGYGHFIRSLGIAGLINEEFTCVFATQQPTDYQIREINKVCSSFIVLGATENHFDEFLTYLKKEDIIVLDNYFFTSEYQLKIKERGCKVIFIDDYNDKNYVCDALINNIPGFTAESFKTKEYTKLYLGSDYALLRQEFFAPFLRQIKKNEKTLFLAFGGTDFFNISEKIIDFLIVINPTFKINLLIGDAYKFNNNLKKYNNLNIYKNISASEVAILMARSYICIVPASSLLNEVASIGSNILAGYFAENQKQPYDYFVDNDLAIGLGDFRELDFKLFKEKLDEVFQSDFLIQNQHTVYHFQQGNNLKKIFYDIRNN